MKKVSILSPCFNGEKYLNGFLDSVLAQSYNNIELILVDDASTDLTESIVKSYISKFEEKGYSLKYIKQDKNKGQAAAINRALKIFDGDYITWTDSDDILYPNAISAKVEFLEKNPEFDFVLNWGEMVNEYNVNISIGYIKRVKPQGEDSLFVDLLDEKNVVFGPGTILVRTDSFKKAIPSLCIYDSRQGQNFQLMLPLAYICKCGYLEEVLFKYVIHGDSHSHMKRLYENELERINDFYTLKMETIKNIPTISEEEINHWKKHNYIHKIYKKYKLALRYFKISDYRKCKKELKENGYQIPVDERILVYLVKKITNKIIKKHTY